MDLLYWPNPILKQKLDPADPADPDLRAQLDEMNQVMRRHGGIGLAANQVGLNKRMFIAWAPGGTYKAFINPRILGFTGTWGLMAEGCLSVPGVVEKVRRCDEVVCESYDLDSGTLFASPYEGRNAHVIQHELEHLDGKIFLDKLPKGTLDRIRALKRRGGR